jgi:redox-sensitive bicupin YhaK (pirin superfamily)
VAVPAGARFEHELPVEHNAFVYVFEGTLTIGAGTKAEIVRRGELAALGQGKRVVLSAGAEAGRAILVGGRPLKEPVAKYGPFVMNTDKEIVQAIQDYQAGRF